jgi:hypothetical protein
MWQHNATKIASTISNKSHAALSKTFINKADAERWSK